MSIVSSKRAIVLHAGWIERFLPTAGVPSSARAWRSSNGFMSAPPATTTASARIAKPLARAEARGDTAGAAGDDVDAVDPRRRDELRAALERRGHVAHVGGALGARGAAEAAHALPVAVRRVAVDRPVVHPEALGPARDDPPHAARELEARPLHAEHRLHALVVRIHRRPRVRREPVLLAPAAEGALGRAVAGAAVDDSGAAHGAPGEHRDAAVADRDGEPLVAIELLDHRLCAPRELLASMEVALLHDEHRAPARRELVRGRRAARAAADDDDLAFEVEILLGAAPVDHLLHPAHRLRLRERVRVEALAAHGLEGARVVEVRDLDGARDGPQEDAAGMQARGRPVLQEAARALGRQRREHASRARHGRDLGRPEQRLHDLHLERVRPVQPLLEAPQGRLAARLEDAPLRHERRADGAHDALLPLAQRGGPVGRLARRGHLLEQARGGSHEHSVISERRLRNP